MDQQPLCSTPAAKAQEPSSSGRRLSGMLPKRRGLLLTLTGAAVLLVTLPGAVAFQPAAAPLTAARNSRRGASSSRPAPPSQPLSFLG